MATLTQKMKYAKPGCLCILVADGSSEAGIIGIVEVSLQTDEVSTKIHYMHAYTVCIRRVSHRILCIRSIVECH